jgi:hypothetical protein
LAATVTPGQAATIDAESPDVLQLGRALVARGCVVSVFNLSIFEIDIPGALEAATAATIPFEVFEPIRAAIDAVNNAAKRQNA